MIKRERITVGLLSGSFVSSYHKELVLGLSDAATRLNVNLVVLTPGSLNSQVGFARSRNLLYSAVSPGILDGLIVPASSLGQFVTPTEFLDFLMRYKGLPTVCVGQEVEGYHSIAPDYRSGMRDILAHLVEAHACRRILLMRGPRNNASYNLRQDAFMEFMNERGISCQDAVCTVPDLSAGTIRASLQPFLQSRALSWDAVVTVNDRMALHVMDSFVEHGIRIPEDIVVTGFLGDSAGQFSQPTLTTVDERIYDLGGRALDLLLSLIQDPKKEPGFLLEPVMMNLRGSCGCHMHLNEDSVIAPHDVDPAEVPLYSLTVDDSELYEELSQKGVRETLQAMALRNLLERRGDRIRYAELFRAIAYRVASPDSMAGIFDIMKQYLGLSDCFVVFFQNQKKPDEKVRLLYAFRDKKHVQLAASDREFVITDFLPAQLLDFGKRITLVAEPLYRAEKLLGYMVYDLCTRNLIMFETLSVLLSELFVGGAIEEELLLAQRRFSDIALVASDLLWESNELLRFTYLSDEVEKMLGYSSTELIGKSLFQLLRPGEDEYIAGLREKMLQNHRQIVNSENWYVCKDGQLVALLMSCTPVFDRENRFIGYRGAFRNLTEGKKAEERLLRMAYYDQLTGLPNRSLLKDRLGIALSEARREELIVAILFLDLDRFKNINDLLGHGKGDAILQSVAAKIKRCLRESDTLARMGGDEFVILAPRLKSAETVVNIANKIITLFREPFVIETQPYFLTTSIGIALFPMDGDDVDTLFKKADTALYKAKEEGKNRYFFYHARLDEKSKQRVQMENLLHLALQNNQFRLFYQPQVHSASGKVAGFEALVRWDVPELGLVSPADFIPVAEESGMIDDLGVWVLETALDQLARWHREGMETLTIAINLSAKQFARRDFGGTFSRIISSSGINPRRVECEITESEVIANERIAVAALHELKSIGVRIALDDFGTGYSSLSYLQRLPIDTVKIDKSFVMSMGPNTQDSIITKTIIDMGHNMHLSVVAEGVETEDQVGHLKTWGCDLLQGYFFSKPLPPDAVVAALRSRDLI